jgi:hypothetical protein
MIRKLAVGNLGIGAVLCAGAVLFNFAPAAAAEAPAAGYQVAEDVPGDKSLIAPEGAQTQPSGAALQHEPPIRFTTVDYQDAGEAAGKLKLAGTAPAGTALYIFFDDNPLTKIAVDDQGKWSLEGEIKLETGNHTLRAEQYDGTTGMLSGRAMVTIARVPPGEAGKDQAAAPAGAPPQKPATP